MAQTKRLGCKRFGSPRIIPRLFAEQIVLRGVQPQYRRKYAKLHPTNIQLVVVLAEMVPADVVTPPSIAAVCRRGGEIRLEV